MYAEKEKPFLITDLIPPELCDSEEALKEEIRIMVGSSTIIGSIPIKTWTTGEPYTVNNSEMVRFIA